MKKVLLSLIIIFFSFSITSRGAQSRSEQESEVDRISAELVIAMEKYSELYKLAEELVIIMEKLASDGEKEDSARAFAGVLRNCTDAIIIITPKFKALLEKYPGINEEDLFSAEFDALDKRAEISSEKIHRKMDSLPEEYLSNPELIEALDNFDRILGNLNKLMEGK